MFAERKRRRRKLRFGGRPGDRLRVVDVDGAPVDACTELPAGAVVYLYREVPATRSRCPSTFPVSTATRTCVVDKPHFLATMPRAATSHRPFGVRRDLNLPNWSPAH